MTSSALPHNTPANDGGLTVRQVVLTEPYGVELRNRPIAAPGPGQVYAETVLSGISHGTEMAWYTGTAPALHRCWDADRRMFADGAGRAYPIGPGYEAIARITAVGPKVTRPRIGDLVYLDRPHATGHLLDAETATAGLLPELLEPERAVFWPLARVALGAVHDTSIRIAETTVVVGLGVVGLLSVQLALLAGASRVIGVDRYPRRLAAARAYGIDTIDATDTDVAARVRDLNQGVGADAAIEASGSSTGLHEAIRACRVAGRVTTVATYHEAAADLRLGEEYHRNRITLVSSMTVNDCPQRGHPAWDLDRLNRSARHLVSTGRLDTEGLISHRVPITRVADAYRLIAERPEDTIKVVLTHEP